MLIQQMKMKFKWKVAFSEILNNYRKKKQIWNHLIWFVIFLSTEKIIVNIYKSEIIKHDATVINF